MLTFKTWLKPLMALGEHGRWDLAYLNSAGSQQVTDLINDSSVLDFQASRQRLEQHSRSTGRSFAANGGQHKGQVFESPNGKLGKKNSHCNGIHEASVLSPLSSPVTRRNLFLILFLLLTHCHCGTLLPWQQNLGRRFSIMFFFFNRKLRPLPHPRRNDWKVTSLAALSDSTQIVFSKTLKCLRWERHSSARTRFFFFFNP